MSIKFGTSGWRALYHEDFTLPNIRIVIQAIAEEVKRARPDSPVVAVGYDVRFMGREIAETACGILAANGVGSRLTDRDVPTPTLSFAIVDGKLAGGINFTASHNPFEYNGIKFSPESGGPALPETTQRIEVRIAELQASPQVKEISFAQGRGDGLINTFDPRPAYFAALEQRVRTAAFAKLAGKRVAVDCKHAVARGYLDEFLRRHGVEVVVLHGEADPYFGREHPEPDAGHVDELQALARANKDIVLGLACDGDADRFGIVDGDGEYVDANLVLALLLDYLASDRGWKGGVARSVATTHLIDRVAAAHGLEVIETPVGFKYIGDLLVRGEIVFGGEESAGLTVDGHLPEKDGVLAGLLVAEMVAETGKSLRELTAGIFARVGSVLDARSAVRLTPAMDASFENKTANPPAQVAGRKVERVDRTDGTKLFLEGGEWVLLRKSGTEPVVRLYAEAADKSRLGELLVGCRGWLK